MVIVSTASRLEIGKQRNRLLYRQLLRVERQHEHADQIRLRGSVGLATDASGAKITDSDTRYSPYGMTRPGLAGTGLPTDRRFTGQREEVSLGLYDYGARPYDPALGRFLQADTLVPDPGNPQSLNRYSYTLGNPLRYTDPSGHFEEDEIDRYLEFQLGITDADERLRIIRQWHIIHVHLRSFAVDHAVF